MTDFESRSLSRSRAAPSRPDQRLPLSLNRMSSLSIVRDPCKKGFAREEKPKNTISGRG
jgi:hypothetical protein